MQRLGRAGDRAALYGGGQRPQLFQSETAQKTHAENLKQSLKKLNFFFNYEFHREELADYLETRIINKIHALEKEHRKQKFTRQRYARDGFYNSESYKEQKEKLDPEDKYRVHKVNF